MEQVLDRVELPLSGLSAELVSSPVGLLRWRLAPGDVVFSAIEQPLEHTPILGWRRGTSAEPSPRPFTAAWGSLLGGRGPLRVVMARRRALRPRTVRRVDLEPATLGGAFWIAESEGDFDQLVVSDGTIVEARDLRPL